MRHGIDSTVPRSNSPRVIPLTEPVSANRCLAFWKLFSTKDLPELGAGPRPDAMALGPLETALDRFRRDTQLEPDQSLRLRAATLLYHDHHDAAHDIVQDLQDTEAAMIHAILHRREPDYWNAKYWFRRFDAHPVYRSLGRRLPSLVVTASEAEMARRLTLPGPFDPFAFVDLCESHEKCPANDAGVTWLRRVQHAEFEELAAHLLA
ncbi:MAG: hypothetical protein RLZ45_1056 [Verrucomicrobiota bacterium]